jgi:hypothetical protein
VAAPAYLEANARAAIPTRLRPAQGSTLAVELVPRPPMTLATLANANPAASASITWVDDDGTGHQEPLWLLVAIPSGGPLQPVPDGRLDVDLYGGSFVRVMAHGVTLADGVSHAFRLRLASSAGPGGAVIADTAALRAAGGVVWFDNGGQLGHVRKDGADWTVAELADAIDAGAMAVGTLDATTDPAHPALILTGAPVGTRRRATLGELVECIGTEPATLLELADAGGTEVDVVGVAVAAPPPEPPDPGRRWESGVTVAELARTLSVPMPSSGSGPTVDRLQLAIATAEDAIGRHVGRPAAGDWPDPVPAGAHVAVVQLATRIYRAADVTFGVLQTELGTAYTGRWMTPELDAALLGLRRSWGVA